ncbi:GNAT superfamily N-acetyltransferase [Paraburkholderia bannensis]|uniref:GNAT superfamily N-acetyltransferase n=1 Tax=Paraburkholderia bannensis TaxID=765414 RepID=A0A7W9U4G8_9BURK|nr:MULTISPECIES: GNAT family N-acetyltransferase [Paraburkholderia]MBB3261857.1 GNAT superfamily N-acetyltransferase [Paraburkholderia sp. WP4_3_2]MBB6106852.1 GNAT superfamily N-acetyltransferase [Paraburkholderia bannensis]
MTIRPAALEDRPALRELFLHTRRATFFWQTAGSFRPGDFDTQTQGEDVLVALEAGTDLTGFISIWRPDRFIHHLFVLPSRQRQGIGPALLRALPNWRVERYRLKCLTRNAAALAFYRAQGFTPIDAGVSEDGAYLLLESR